MTPDTAARKETRKDIRCTPDAKELFDSMFDTAKAEGTFTGTKQEFLGFILKDYQQLKTAPKPMNTHTESALYADDDNEKPIAWFTNIGGKTKEEKDAKYNEIREMLGVQEDIIYMTRAELYEKAAKISGKSVEEIVKTGSDSEAQSIITQMRKPVVSGQGQGRLGGADAALDAAFIEIAEMLENGSYQPRGDVPITKIGNRAGTNFNSAKGWAARRNFEFPMAIDHAIKLAKDLAAKA